MNHPGIPSRAPLVPARQILHRHNLPAATRVVLPAQRASPYTGDVIRVTTLFFASTRDAVGQRSLAVPLPEGATVDDLLQGLVSDYPALAPRCASLMVAVNSEYAQRSTRLRDGDEVALIPPVSGGANVEF